MTASPDIQPDRFSAAARQGLRVFPAKPGGKEPALKWTQFAELAPTVEQLQDWDASRYNVGVICGNPSNVVVLDVDCPEAQEAVDGLDLPPTPCVRTARGRHYYFRSPTQCLRNAAKIADMKLDFRGAGGYVIGAGSIHPSGMQYEWEVSPDDVPFAELPRSVLELLKQPQRSAKKVGLRARASTMPGGRFADFLAEKLAAALTKIEAASEGERNDTLFRAGVELANDVAAAGFGWDPFADRLTEAAGKIGLEAPEIAATLASCWSTGQVNPTPWIKTATEWVFLSKPDTFYHVQSGESLARVAFNNTFMSQRPAASTLSAHLLSKQLVEVVQNLDYEPTSEARFVERDGLTWLNTYRPSGVFPVAGDARPFEEFVSYLVPDPTEREHLLRMIAWTVRNPGRKLRHALLMQSSVQGIGKSMLIEIWGRLLGKSNVRKTTTEEVTGQYQGFIKETLLVVLEELNWGVGPMAYNRLKDLITGSEASVNEKFQPVRMWPNVATLVILTNIEVPLIIESMDRRFFYISSPARMREPDYYGAFAAWWSANLSVIRGYLDTIDLSEFDPFAPPPMTAAKVALIAGGRTDLVRELALAIEDRTGPFERDLVTLERIEMELSPVMRGKSKVKLREALVALGCKSFGQQRLPVSSIGRAMSQPDRASLWAIRNTRFWDVAGNQERGVEFRRTEGLLAEFAEWPFEILHISEFPS